jgi:hypothetical protein
VNPVGTLLQVDRDLIHQGLPWRNTTLRRPNGAVVVSRVVKVYTVGMEGGHLVRETVGRVHTNGVVLVDLNHWGTVGSKVSPGRGRGTKRGDTHGHVPFTPMTRRSNSLSGLAVA